jgi:uncharacterized protein (TIGR02466 family)
MNQAAEIHNFFPTPIQLSGIEDAADLNKSIMLGVQSVMETEPNSMPQGWSCSVYTTMKSPIDLLERPEFKPLRSVIMSEATSFARSLHLDIDKHPLRLNECWLNVYATGQAQEVHVHPNSVLSGIYYAQAPEGCGELLLHSPYADIMLDPPTTRNAPLNASIIPIHPQDGMMVLFRSFVRHSVKPNLLKCEERVSIAFNLTM